MGWNTMGVVFLWNLIKPKFKKWCPYCFPRPLHSRFSLCVLICDVYGSKYYLIMFCFHSETLYCLRCALSVASGFVLHPTRPSLQDGVYVESLQPHSSKLKHQWELLQAWQGTTVCGVEVNYQCSQAGANEQGSQIVGREEQELLIPIPP